MAVAWAFTASPVLQNLAFGSSTATFTSIAIGTASADRQVVVAAFQDQNLAGGTFSCTVGGAAATEVTSRTDHAGAIFICNVAAGTTANIVLTASINMGWCGIAVGILTGANATPTVVRNAPNTDDNSSPHVFTATVPSSGAGVAFYMFYSDSSATLTNATQDSYVTSGGSSRELYLVHTTTAGSQAVTMTGLSFVGTIGCMACWGPSAAAGGIVTDAIPQTMGPMIGGFFG
jgi:hypothetical protein